MDAKDVWIAVESQARKFSQRMRHLSRRWYCPNPANRDKSLEEGLRNLLDLFWAADWLLGPAKAALGIRSIFYQRITLERFAYCLALVQLSENRLLICPES